MRHPECGRHPGATYKECEACARERVGAKATNIGWLVVAVAVVWPFAARACSGG